MLHLEYLTEGGNDDASFVKRATGRYYTGEAVGRRLAAKSASALFRASPEARSVSVVDPFGGDGRLVAWFIEAWAECEYPDVLWDISIWDLTGVGFDAARARFAELSTRLGAKYQAEFKTTDSFVEILSTQAKFDIVLTNPPWELLKPDRRELASLTPESKSQYIAHMRSYDNWLGEHFPLSQPRRKFAGWGTNLSRVGLEASLSLVRRGGILGAVLPASFLADDQTGSLRRHLVNEHSLISATYYPAEAKLYESADIVSIAITLQAEGEPTTSLAIGTHDVVSGSVEESTIKIDRGALSRINYVLPISFGSKLVPLLHSLSERFPKWIELESCGNDSLWAGREIDETGIARWLHPPSRNLPRFVKGRMIGRFTTFESPSHAVAKPDWIAPNSVNVRRIAWRDVSRPSQKRRMIATIIRPGWVAGNSIGVAYFKDLSELPLLALLGIMNSTCFEFQLRAHLATGHVSLSALRKVAVPGLPQLRRAAELADLVSEAIACADETAAHVDAYVAKNLYQLTEQEYQLVLGSFASLSESELLEYLTSYRSIPAKPISRAVRLDIETMPSQLIEPVL